MSTRGAIFIILCLAISAPVIDGFVSNQINATAAGERIAVAILIAWIGVTIVGKVIDTYQTQPQRRRAKAQLVGTEKNEPSES